MKRTMLLGCFAATTALWTPAFGETPGREKIVSGQVAASKLELRGLEVGSEGSVTGTVVNGRGVVIEDVELLVSHTWSWSDERHPGQDNPGRVGYVRVTGEIPAKSSMAFSYTPDPPLPKRTDGSFQTTVAVHSFTEIGD
jgi:hypothetical protein